MVLCFTEVVTATMTCALVQPITEHLLPAGPPSPFPPSTQLPRFLCKGRVDLNQITPSVVTDTSTASRLSAAWVGTAVVGNATSNYSAVKVSMSTSFGVNDSYFVTTVTLQSLVSTPLYNVSWMRNVDPDQEQVGTWQRNYTTPQTEGCLVANQKVVFCSSLLVVTWLLLSASPS